MIYAAALWGIILILYLVTLAVAIKQYWSPYQFQEWRLAWGFKIVAMAFLIARRVYLLVTLRYLDVPTDTELELTLPFALCLCCANWYHSRVYHQPFTIPDIPPAIIRINAHSRVLSWDAAAVALFGFTGQEVLGKDLAELVIPVQFRETHRTGLRRWLATREGSNVIGRTLPLTALHKDGSELAVEIHVEAYDTAAGVEFLAEVRRLIRL